jgi:hypothetical protein
MSDAVPRALREQVAAEARHRCGYCLTDQGVSGAQMHIEHIVPRVRGGPTVRPNLWLSCAWRNSFKGTRVAALDPVTGVEVPLFNPRDQVWSAHFQWDQGGTWIVGLTPAGRATVEALRLNNPYIVPARRLGALAGLASANDRVLTETGRPHRRAICASMAVTLPSSQRLSDPWLSWEGLPAMSPST